MTKAGHTDAQEVGPAEESLTVFELHPGRILHHGGRARDGVATRLEGSERLIHPTAFGVPVGDRCHQLSFGLHLPVDARVVGHLHLINGHRVGFHRHRLGHGLLPLFRSLLHHAGDEVDVDLGEADFPGVGVGPLDLLGAVGASVDFQDVVIEVFDAQTQSGDTHFADGPQLVIGECAGLGFEGDFGRFIPREQALHAFGEIPELVRRQVARSASSKINEAGFPASDHRLLGVAGNVFEQRIEVGLDVVGILVGVDAEVAEMATLPAEGDVGVEPQRNPRLRFLIERLMEGGNGLGAPESERGIIGHEVIPGGRLPLDGRARGRRRRGNGDGTHGRAVVACKAPVRRDDRQ